MKASGKFAFFLSFCMGCTAAMNGQAAVVFNSANGHYYDAVAALDPDWAQARDAAAASSYNGLSGYLATVTSQAENDFIVAHFPEALDGGYWLGGHQLPGSAEPDGGWTWVTGEPWAYANWGGGEPNNYANQENEDSLHFTNDINHVNGLGTWNDLRGSGPRPRYYFIGGYVVEYSVAPPPIPEPATSTLLLVAFGALGLNRLSRRKSPSSAATG
jgi:hypothetical protein